MSYPSRLHRALLAAALGAVPIAAAGGALAVATTPPSPTPTVATPTVAPQQCETPTAETANEPARMQAQYGAGGGKIILNWTVGRGAAGETLCLDQPMSWDLHVDGEKIAGPIDSTFGGQYTVEITGRHVFTAVPRNNTSKVQPIYGAFTVPTAFGTTPTPTPATPPVTPTPAPRLCMDPPPGPTPRGIVDQVTGTTARYTWNRVGCVFTTETRTILLNGEQVYTTAPGAFQGSFTFKRLQPGTTYTVTSVGDAPPWALNVPIETVTFTTAGGTTTPTPTPDTTPTPTPTPDTTPTPTPTPWMTLSPAPRTPTATPAPTPAATAHQAYALQGTTKLATLTKGTMPLTGSVDATLGLETGDVTAELALNDTQGRLTALGFLPVTATVGFVSSGPTLGKLDDDRLLTTSKVRVKVRSVKAFGAIPLAGGNDCQTKQLSTIQLTSVDAFDPTGSGGELFGTFRLSDLNGCGPFGGIVSALTAGDGNTIDVKLTPTP